MRTNKYVKLLTMLLAVIMILIGRVEARAEEGPTYTLGGQIQLMDAQTGKKIGIAGAEYQVSDGAGNVMEKVTTNATGSIYLRSTFRTGDTYFVKTLTPPKGYALDPNPRSYTVSLSGARSINGQQSFVFEVQEQPIRARVQQVDTSGNPIKEAGSIFTIYDSNGKLFDTVSTNAQGVAELHKNIPYGNYMLKATKAPVGYYLNRATVNFAVADSTLTTLSNGSKLCTVTVRDEILHGRLVMTEENRSKVIRQANCTYDIYDAEGRLFDTVTTDKNGIADFHDKLPYGKYTAIVTKAPTAFWKDPKAFAFEVSEYDVKTVDGIRLFEVKFPHKPIMPTVLVNSVGEALTGTKEVTENGQTVLKPVYGTAAPLYGARYVIAADEDIYLNKTMVLEESEVFAELTVTEDDNKTEEMYLGNYIVIETKTPYGYEQGEDIELNVKAKSSGNQNPTQTMDVPHRMRVTKITFLASAEGMSVQENEDGTVVPKFSQNGVEGFLYGLYTAEEFDILKEAEEDEQEQKEEEQEAAVEKLPAGTLVATAVSDKNGNVIFEEKLPFGKYVVKELAAPEGYAVNEDGKMDLTNKGDAGTSGPIEVKLSAVEHPYATEQITVTATSSDGKPIPGALVEIRDANGNVVLRAKTNEEGALEDVTLVPGSYEARQIEVGDGYELCEEPLSFVVADGEQTAPVGFVSVTPDPEQTQAPEPSTAADGQPAGDGKWKTYIWIGAGIVVVALTAGFALYKHKRD